MKKYFISVFVVLCCLALTPLAGAKVGKISKATYAGAIAIDADTGQVLFEDNADLQVYPASIVKLIDLLILLEHIDKGLLRLTDTVTATAEATGMGGTQVWLAEHEVFTVEDLLYAIIIRSANDAAAALAIHAAGTREAFVELMNRRAKELGMTSTTFHSVHGLPPGQSQLPDITTPRDLATLARAMVKRTDVFKYTSVRQRTFRPGPHQVDMVSHNNLLKDFEGCDGLKTGYFKAGGHSVVATATRNNRRIIAVVMGSESKAARDAEARKLISKGFIDLASLPPPVPEIATNAVPEEPARTDEMPKSFRWKRFWLITGIILLAAWAISAIAMHRSRRLDY